MPSINPTQLNAATISAEQRVRTALEQVKAAEKKARAAKDKVWRAKLSFKLARRAWKKTKKTAKRARAKAVQAQIALKELTEQIAPATRLSAKARPRAAGQFHKRSAPIQSSVSAQRNPPAPGSTADVNASNPSARPASVAIKPVARPLRAEPGS